MLLLLIKPGTVKQTENYPDENIYYSRILEEKIEDFLENVNGINNVSVIVTLDCGSTMEYAEKNNASADYLVLSKDGGEEAVLIREVYPIIRGVSVVCTKGDSSSVRDKIVSLLSTGLGIGSNKISVCGSIS